MSCACTAAVGPVCWAHPHLHPPTTRLDEEVRQLREELLAAPKVDHLQRYMCSSLVKYIQSEVCVLFVCAHIHVDVECASLPAVSV